MSNEQTDSERLSDLAGRIFRHATPQMGFNQGDSDFLHCLARRLGHPATIAIASLRTATADDIAVGAVVAAVMLAAVML